MDRVLGLVLEKQSVQNPDVGANIVVTTQKHIHYMPFFSPSCILYPKKTVGLWEIQKELLQNYCKIAQVWKKKEGFFILLLFSFFVPSKHIF